MNKYILILGLLFLSACENKTESKKIIPKKIEGYHIFGTVPSFEEKTILLQKKDFENNYKTIQYTTVKNNTFEFIGDNTNIDILYIGFKNSEHKLPIIINNFETVVEINPTDLDKSKITGSLLQKEYIKYLKGLNKAKNKFVFKTKWIKNNSSSPIAVIVLSEMLGKNKWRLNQNKIAFQTLSKKNKNSALGLAIKNHIDTYFPKVENEKVVAEFSLNPEIENKTSTKNVTTKTTNKTKKKLPKRRKAPNFYAESLNGNDISLNDVKKNAKVTLIDFWASWCAPCRASNPHLVRLHNKYYKDGFRIISISEDDINKKHLWKNAIKQDGLKWYNVIDDDARVATMYGVKGIPHTVLLDKNGGIIFTKKTTYTIEKKLKEIFGY
jgi:thiol-disulfide isomerase/thioredoxin